MTTTAHPVTTPVPRTRPGVWRRLLAGLLREPGPDSRAVAQGLTVRRIGWGTYAYTGLPTHMTGRRRRVYDPHDPLDRLVCGPPQTPSRPRP